MKKKAAWLLAGMLCLTLWTPTVEAGRSIEGMVDFQTITKDMEETLLYYLTDGEIGKPYQYCVKPSTFINNEPTY